MNDSKLSRRYAKSLLDLAAERNETELAYNDLSLIYATIKSSRDLALFFKNPIIHTDKKITVIEKLFGANVSALTLSFLKIITSKKRESHIEGISRSFIHMYREMKGITTALILTPVKLDDSVKAELLTYLKSETNRKVELSEQIDRSLIGGFILRWGDKQVDASVSRKLRLLKMDFSQNLYLKDY
ncbi:MAG: ATP synthase F1 subunit delta [Bacteroidia bacterium]|nr:ATP synthase F1 subunit delta [Bacteroidia bacterium]MCZ2278500.1 ATP synthase F1 subunit delta [Bacteroidia bacterium]